MRIPASLPKFTPATLAFGGSILAAACGQPSFPTAPTHAADLPPTSFSITFDTSLDDSLINGSEAQLVGFDLATRQLTFNTTKGIVTAAFDSSSVFRDAQLSKFSPTDPCHQFAIDYNTAGATVDTNGVLQAISAMTGSGCLARVLVDRNQPNPPPIKSFRPLAGS